MKQVSVIYCIFIVIFFSDNNSDAFILPKHQNNLPITITISNRHPSISSKKRQRANHRQITTTNKRQRATNHQITTTNIHMLPIDESDQILALWVVAFASSHIGMSATRTNIISSLGDVMEKLNLVGNDDWKLPDYWPGDNTGGQQIFPDSLTAGRQVYRALYTTVSFITLGSAFAAYLQSSAIHGDVIIDTTTQSLLYRVCLCTGALGFGAAIASLFNASPLGLMPSFEAEGNDNNTRVSGKAIAGITRDDTLKFTTRGLTRITRHPLILPVVPWGFATAYLASGRTCDLILFGGLSIYAIAGCYAQDLRVIKEEGSVGTVFGTEQGRDNDNDEDERNQLQSFFEQTSFVPFKAVLDGRQSLEDIGREVPWLQFVVGTVLGLFAEEKILQLLKEWSSSI